MSTILDHDINTLPVSMEFTATDDVATIVVPFAFKENIDDIHLEVNAVDSTGTYTYKLTSNNVLAVTPSIPKGSVVYIYRETDVDKSLYTLNDGAVFTASNIDANFNQIRKSQQELIGRFKILKARVDSTLSEAGTVLTEAKQATQDAKQATKDVQDAIFGKINDGVVGTWSGRTQRDKNKEVISVEDFGASTASDAQTNNNAFYALEQAYSGRIVDLHGCTYKVLGDFYKNKYINGSLYVSDSEIYGKGLQTINDYKFNVGNGVAVGKYVAIHPDGDSGVATAPYTGIQGFAFDAVTNTMYAQTTYVGDGATQSSRIVKFDKLGCYPTVNNKLLESAPTLDIGHQNLALTKDANGNNVFWATAGASKYGSRALYVVRFKFDEVKLITTEVEFIKVFDADNWVNDASRVMGVSPCGKWLVTFNARKSDGAWFCRVFKVSDLADASVDHSNHYTYQFQVTKQGLPVQGIAIDDKGVYILHGGMTDTGKTPFAYIYGKIEVRSLNGTLIGIDTDIKLCRQTAEEVFAEHSTTQYYEDECLGFVPTGVGTWKLAMMAITGRVNGHLYNSLVICDSSSVTTLTGTKTKPALTITGYPKVSFPNISSGLEFQVQYASKSAETVATLSPSGVFVHPIHNLRRAGTPYTRAVNTNGLSTANPTSNLNIYNLQPAVLNASGNDVITGALQHWQLSTGGYIWRLFAYNSALSATTGLTINGYTQKIELGNVLNLAVISVYADNASAKSGGLVSGDVYRTSDGTLKIVYT